MRAVNAGQIALIAFAANPPKEETNPKVFDKILSPIPRGHTLKPIDPITVISPANTATTLIIHAISSGFFSTRCVNLSMRGVTASINFWTVGKRAFHILSFIFSICAANFCLLSASVNITSPADSNSFLPSATTLFINACFFSESVS